MDLPKDRETRRGEGRRNPAAMNRRKARVETTYLVGIICLQGRYLTTVQFSHAVRIHLCFILMHSEAGEINT